MPGVQPHRNGVWWAAAGLPHRCGRSEQPWFMGAGPAAGMPLYAGFSGDACSLEAVCGHARLWPGCATRRRVHTAQSYTHVTCPPCAHAPGVWRACVCTCCVTVCVCAVHEHTRE